MSKDMRMKIKIDGDNSGFRQTLQQTGQDMKRFQNQTNQKQGMSAGEMIGALTAKDALIGIRRNVLRGSAAKLGIPDTHKGLPYAVQQMSGGLLGNPSAGLHGKYAQQSLAELREARKSRLRQRMKDANLE